MSTVFDNPRGEILHGAAAPPSISDESIVRRLEQTRHTHPKEIGCRVDEFRELLKEIQRLRHERREHAKQAAESDAHIYNQLRECARERNESRRGNAALQAHVDRLEGELTADEPLPIWRHVVRVLAWVGVGWIIGNFCFELFR